MRAFLLSNPPPDLPGYAMNDFAKEKQNRTRSRTLADWRAKALDRAGHACACGCRQAVFVYPADGNPHNLTDDNALVLCPVCWGHRMSQRSHALAKRSAPTPSTQTTISL